MHLYFAADAVADFEPTWVLVVTWVNLPYITYCRDVAIIKSAFDYEYSSTAGCEDLAKRLAVSLNKPVLRFCHRCLGLIH